MRVLYLEWNSFTNDFVKREMIRRGYDVVLFDFPQKTEDTRKSEELASHIAVKAIETSSDFIFSLNFFPVAAIAANACKIKYISWTYDSPYIQLYSRTIDFPTNYAFIFDKAEYNRIKALGINTVYFLPMAGAAEDYDKLEISKKEHERYDADIAMIGSMYSEQKHRLMRHFDKADEYVNGYVNALIQAQKQVCGANIMEKALNDDIVGKIQKYVPVFPHGDGFETSAWVLSNYFLARKVTAEERFEYIKALSENMNVALYTHEPTPDIPKADNRGSLDYYTEMPKAMKCAKINLNITLRSIVTGIPLRAFDIMAAGGFLLTSYQDDLLDFFEPGVDFVFFDGKDDLTEKAKYYLDNDKERETIARNGYEKVKLYHSYKDRFDEMERVVFSDE